MIGASSVDVERKVNAILRVLRDSPEAVGARVIGRQLAEQGIDLSERAVRYHLKLMDERGLTQLVGRDGRQITEAGLEELRKPPSTGRSGGAACRPTCRSSARGISPGR
jgi:repressor of nif and glnA expression